VDWHQQKPGTLVPEVHGLLQSLPIERPPLGVRLTPSIRQGN
jgi:hypothetical protein